MIRDEKFILLVSDSTHVVMKTESLLKERGLTVRIIPLPGELKASCGLSIKCQLENLSEIKEVLKELEHELEVYEVEKIGLKKSYKKLF